MSNILFMRSLIFNLEDVRGAKILSRGCSKQEETSATDSRPQEY